MTIQPETALDDLKAEARELMRGTYHFEVDAVHLMTGVRSFSKYICTEFPDWETVLDAAGAAPDCHTWKALRITPAEYERATK